MESRESHTEEGRLFVRNHIESMERLERSGKRFLEWKLVVKNLLQCAGLWDVVDPDQIAVDRLSGVPSDGVPNDERKKAARNMIQETVAFYIKANRDPRDCWMYLQNRFAPNTPIRRFEYTRRLWHLRMEEGEKVQEFASRVQDVLNHLHDMGVFIEEKQLVMIIIAALPRSWHRGASVFWNETDRLTNTELLCRRMRVVEKRNEARDVTERSKRLHGKKDDQASSHGSGGCE